jgi:hypothetical protein
MATFNKFNSFVEVAVEGANLGSDTFKVALTNTAPTAGNSVLADITFASGAGSAVSTGNLDSVTLTTTSSSQTSGTYKLVLQDKTMTASGTVGPFQYIVIYDDTVTSPADPLVGFYNYGSPITLNSGDSFTVNFDETNGFIQFA